MAKLSQTANRCDLAVGDKVLWGDTHVPGTIKFIGTTQFAAGEWFGVELDEEKGKNNGTVNEVMYFACKENHGVFVRGTCLTAFTHEDAPTKPTLAKPNEDAPTKPTLAKPKAKNAARLSKAVKNATKRVSPESTSGKAGLEAELEASRVREAETKQALASREVEITSLTAKLEALDHHSAEVAALQAELEASRCREAETKRALAKRDEELRSMTDRFETELGASQERETAAKKGLAKSEEEINHAQEAGQEAATANNNLEPQDISGSQETSADSALGKDSYEAWAEASHSWEKLVTFRHANDCLDWLRGHGPSPVRKLAMWMNSGFFDNVQIDEFVEALSLCSRSHAYSLTLDGGTDTSLTEETWKNLVWAAFSNPRIVSLIISRCGAVDEISLMRGALDQFPLMRNIGILMNETKRSRVDQGSFVALVQILVNRPPIGAFTVPSFDVAMVSGPMIAALAKLRQVNPDLEFGPGARLLDSLVASVAVANDAARTTVISKQEQLLRAFTAGNLGQAMDVYRCLVNDIARPEQDRLLKLFPKLLEKYSFIGGWEFVKALPDDMDTYKGTDVAGQFISEPMLAMPAECQVHYVLGVAYYKQHVLWQLCLQVEHAMESLVSCTSAAEVPNAVETLFGKEELNDISCTRIILDCRGGGEGHGIYKQCGYAMGMPAFYCAQHDKYLWCTDLNWVVSDAIGDTISGIRLSHEPGMRHRHLPILQEGDSIQAWTNTGNYHYISSVTLAHPEEFLLRDAVTEFLQRRLEEKEMQQILGNDDVLYKLKFGPPKGFSRAMHKQAKWLLDINRCTFILNSATMLAMTFHLLDRHVKAMGGEVSRLSNYFFKDGYLNQNMTSPPCVHLNLRIDRWTYEVMLMLHDFASAKELIHKFYEIVRSSHPIELLAPIFEVPPTPSDPTRW